MNILKCLIAFAEVDHLSHGVSCVNHLRVTNTCKVESRIVFLLFEVDIVVMESRATSVVDL